MIRTAGYTNHWVYTAGAENPTGGFSDQQWDVIVREAKAILASARIAGVTVTGPMGTGRPSITSEHISLNGDKAQNLEHETFYLVKTPSEEDRRFHQQFLDTFGKGPTREIARGFCKTNGKPYDEVVASILAVANRVGKGVFRAKSDDGALKRVLASRTAEGIKDACWEGYEAVGMKEKDGKQVPNCVPTKAASNRVVTRHVAAWDNLPEGWTEDSLDSFWESLTGDVKHPVTKCIKRMDGKVSNPGAFCGSLADKADPGWRSRGAADPLARTASTRVAYNPPFQNAAKADEALGEAYRSLIDLKLGFDSWEEIPQSAHPLYQQIMKAVDAVVTARQTTTQVRGMVAKKRY